MKQIPVERAIQRGDVVRVLQGRFKGIQGRVVMACEQEVLVRYYPHANAGERGTVLLARRNLTILE